MLESTGTIKLGRYKHYKGGYYELLDIAINKENDEDYAIYRSLEGNYANQMTTWIRPWEDFKEKFEYVDNKI